MPVGVIGWLLVSVGALVLGAGVTFLLSVRRVVRGQAVEASPDAHPSPPTRYLIAAGLLVLGYHLIVWGVPALTTPLAVPVSSWWLVPGLVVLLIAASLWLDRLE